ncbi:TrmH family RNA methyltransferase [Dermatophilus congolensis]|uniref:TrmH family RNA methyltransferase n=1 Tax=Dermatophilus congolensis TaxID=1863 RepID=UPI003986EF1F
MSRTPDPQRSYDRCVSIHSNRRTRSILDNPRAERVRRVRALLRRSVRQKEGRFLAEGPQAVREAVAWCPQSIIDVYVDPHGRERHKDIVDAALAAGVFVHDVTAEVLAVMADTESPQGVLAVVEKVDVPLEKILEEGSDRPRMLVMLAAVRDPGNAGTVLRGADAMGADAVLVGSSSVDLYNPKVVRSTVGSLFHLPVVTGVDVQSTLMRLREEAGVVAYAADGEGDTPITEADLTRSHVWVMGNEAWGLTEEMSAACDQVVSIPLHRAESLNLAMAATICMFASSQARG